jgi:hypothetical protein
MTCARVTSLIATSAFLCVAIAACGSEPAPSDCGDPSMSIVTLKNNKEEDDPIRWCVDIHAAARLDASPTSAGVDESYAVSRPGVYPWTNLTFREAAEACGRAGKFLCDYDVIKLITPTGGQQGGSGAIAFDLTPITSVPRNGPETGVAHRFDPVNAYDMVIAGNTGKPPFPESTKSVAYWSIVPEKDDQYVDETEPYVTGSIAGGTAVGGYTVASALTKEDFKHPLLGFRCCINAKMRDSFEPLAEDPRRRRPAPDTEVPLAP